MVIRLFLVGRVIRAGRGNQRLFHQCGLFDEVRAYEADKFLAGFEGRFELCQRQLLQVPLQLTQQSLAQLLLMTPYAWKARAEKRAALERSESFTTQAAFSLMLFRKRDAISP